LTLVSWFFSMCYSPSPTWHKPIFPFPLRLRAAFPSCPRKPVIYWLEYNKRSGDIAQFDLLIHIRGLALILYLENAAVSNVRDFRSRAACVLASATLEETTGNRKCRKRWEDPASSVTGQVISPVTYCHSQLLPLGMERLFLTVAKEKEERIYTRHIKLLCSSRPHCEERWGLERVPERTKHSLVNCFPLLRASLCIHRSMSQHLPLVRLVWNPPGEIPP